MLATLSRTAAVLALAGLTGLTDLHAQSPSGSKPGSGLSNTRANPADVLRRQASSFQTLRTGPIADPRFHRSIGRKQLVSDFRGAVRPGLRRGQHGAQILSAGALLRQRPAAPSRTKVEAVKLTPALPSRPASGGAAKLRPAAGKAANSPPTGSAPQRHSLAKLLGQHGMVDRFGRPVGQPLAQAKTRAP